MRSNCIVTGCLCIACQNVIRYSCCVRAFAQKCVTCELWQDLCFWMVHAWRVTLTVLSRPNNCYWSSILCPCAADVTHQCIKGRIELYLCIRFEERTCLCLALTTITAMFWHDLIAMRSTRSDSEEVICSCEWKAVGDARNAISQSTNQSEHIAQRHASQANHRSRVWSPVSTTRVDGPS